jgi:phosphoserine phosphatase
MSALHVFDLDGTLLQGTTASLEIARAVGRVPELLALEESFTGGAISTYEFALGAYDIYAGLTVAAVARVFQGCSWIGGIARVVDDIRSRGENCAVVTMSPDFFAEHLLAMGFDEVHASRFGALPLRHRPQPASILSPIDKVRIVGEMLQRRAVVRARCFAYGDSSSDLPLFRHLRHTVAVNANEALRAVASMHCDGDDLWPMYRALRALAESSATAPYL